MKTFIFGKKAVSPVIGTILMVAITVIMAAIVGGFVYQTGRPKISPNLATTLEDDERVILVAGAHSGRIAKLTVEGGKNIALSELKVLVTYHNGTPTRDEITGVNAATLTAGAAVAIGATGTITVTWFDSDASGDMTPGDRLDFRTTAPASDVGSVTPRTDFTVKITHMSTEAILADHTIKVY